MQGIPLIVVQEKGSSRRRKICQAAADCALTHRELIRVGQVQLPAPEESGGAQGDLPPADSRAIDRQREKNIGIADAVVVKEISRPSVKSIGVDDPGFQWN